MLVQKLFKDLKPGDKWEVFYSKKLSDEHVENTPNDVYTVVESPEEIAGENPLDPERRVVAKVLGGRNGKVGVVTRKRFSVITLVDNSVRLNKVGR